jgi:hypothetical protein
LNFCFVFFSFYFIAHCCSFQEQDVLLESIHIRTLSLASADKFLDQGEGKDDADVILANYFPRWTNGFSRLELHDEQITALTGAAPFADVLFTAVYETLDAHLANITLDLDYFNQALLNLQTFQHLASDPGCGYQRAATIVHNTLLFFFSKVLALSLLGDNPVVLQFSQALNNEESLQRINDYFMRLPLLQTSFLCNLRRKVGEQGLHTLLQMPALSTPFELWLAPWKSSLRPNVSARLVAKHLFPFQFVSSVPGIRFCLKGVTIA